MKEQLKFPPAMAKPSIPVEKPTRRLIPEIAYPVPLRKPIPYTTPTEPIKTPREPVPARR